MRLRQALFLALAILAPWWITASSVLGQSSIPNGVFVQNSDGLVWLVLDGQRVKIPVWPAADDEIAAVPVADSWAVMNDDGAIVAGDRPAWLGDGASSSAAAAAAAAAPAATAATPTPRTAPTATSVPPATSAPAPTAAPAAKRIGDSTTLTSPAGLRIVVTVFSVKDNAKSTNQFNTPKGRWVVTEWEVKNEGTTDAKLFRGDFKLQTADGSLVTYGNGAGHPEPELDTDTLGPGQRTRGYLAFDVPSGKGLAAAIYQPSGARQFVIADLTQ
jgi:hypothetical protein